MKRVCGSSLKIQVEICKYNFLRENHVYFKNRRNIYFLFLEINIFSIFGRKNSDLTATTWRPVYFVKHIRVEKRQDLYQISLAKVLQRHLNNQFRIFCGRFRENPSHGHLISQITFSRNHLVPILSDFWNPKFLCDRNFLLCSHQKNTLAIQ